MKQARAFGVGVVLATQNPMDLDYRALSNAGLWCIGRLQTDADRERVVDGLASATGRAVECGARADAEAASVAVVFDPGCACGRGHAIDAATVGDDVTATKVTWSSVRCARSLVRSPVSMIRRKACSRPAVTGSTAAMVPVRQIQRHFQSVRPVHQLKRPDAGDSVQSLNAAHSTCRVAS
jgi:hypothetical protein